MKPNLQLIWRLLWCVATATAYQVATNPYVFAVLLAIAGHWRAGAALVLGWLALCAVAVATGVHRKSRLAGLEDVDIFTAHRYLGLLGDEQQGWTPPFLVAKWPRWAPLWLVAFSCCAWRNRLRNLPFVPSLAWLHRPEGETHTVHWTIGDIGLSLKSRGLFTELHWYWIEKRLFGDIGPRLDQPDQWGGISWAFRLVGKW